jgi:hypothetical protein
MLESSHAQLKVSAAVMRHVSNREVPVSQTEQKRMYIML